MAGSPRLALLLLLLLSAAGMPNLSVEEPGPTRAAFLREVLDARPTPVTPRFDDYTPGSYHVDKQDLLSGLADEADQRKVPLRCLLVTGPDGILWAYSVTVFFQEGGNVRVNSLVMPHARITYKSTRLITAARYGKWLAGLLKLDSIRDTPPANARQDKDGELNDSGYTVLLAAWDREGGKPKVYYGAFGQDDEKRKLFAEHFDAILSLLERTYPPKTALGLLENKEPPR
jgi:hypothetical protein